MRSTRFAAVMLGSALAVLEVPAAAGADPLVHGGFMARLGLGGGYLSASESTSFGDVTVSGPTFTDHVALGGYIAPGFAIHGTFWQSIAINPSVSAGGVSGSTSNASVSQTAFGIGATYFLSPADVFLSASLGIGTLAASHTSGSITSSAQTKIGFALNAIVGKEWGVTPNWGLGLAGQFSYQSNSDDLGGGNSATINTLAFGLLFSATYH